MAIAVASFGVAHGALGQSAPEQHPSPWTFTIDVGEFVQGNRSAVESWLRRNSYGAPEPKHCGFDFLFRPVCDDASTYPQASGGVVAGMASIRRTLSDRWALQLLAATEQSGVVTGRCDDLAAPKDPRCTNRFKEVPFSGGSVALLAVVATRYLHVGAGPALLMANWEMKPAHLAGMWFDATVDRDPWPIFARVQYRIYRSTTLAPDQGFSSFHPSTLFVGLGVMTRANNVGL
jgi:hypothetical protein